MKPLSNDFFVHEDEGGLGEPFLVLEGHLALDEIPALIARLEDFRRRNTPADRPWIFGFGPKGAENAWRCQRCGTIMPKNRAGCSSCAYTVFDPVHRGAES